MGPFAHIAIVSTFWIKFSLAGDINQDVTNGELFLKELLDGKEKPFTPEFLVFTAPNRLCDGVPCRKRPGDFEMSFPLYIGKKARNKYQESYPRDRKIIHRNRLNAPFRSSTTRLTTTPCPDEMRQSSEINIDIVEFQEKDVESELFETSDGISETTQQIEGITTIYPCIPMYPCFGLVPPIVGNDQIDGWSVDEMGVTAKTKYTGRNEDIMLEWEMNKKRLATKKKPPIMRTLKMLHN